MLGRSFPDLVFLILIISLLRWSQFADCQNASFVVPHTPFFPNQTFKTTDFHPPLMEIVKAGETVPGFLFFAPLGPSAEKAPLIMTETNELIWEGPHGLIFNFGVQTYHGQRVITYWNGTRFPEPVGRGFGTIHLWNEAYEEVGVVSLSGNFKTLNATTYPSNIDLHEIFITPRGTVVVTANNVTQTDLRAVGGPQDGWVVDCMVYEIDIQTNQVVFRWSALEHVSEIPLTESLYPRGSEGFSGTSQATAWNYFHINSAATLGDSYLISSRYLCSAIAIDSGGNLLWRLQGRDGGDFELSPGANFCYQHEIRALDGRRESLVLSMHDNANAPLSNGTTPSSGLTLAVNLQSRKASLIQRYLNPKNPIYAVAQGSFQPLDAGHVFLGHGYVAVMEEFDATGSIALTATFGTNSTLSYRAFKYEWIGCPKEAPIAVAVPEDGGLAVYMSWNGGTEYEGWAIYSGADPSQLQLVQIVAKDGFETRVLIDDAKFVRVQALMATWRCGYTEGERQSVIIAV